MNMPNARKSKLAHEVLNVAGPKTAKKQALEAVPSTYKVTSFDEDDLLAFR
jgi:hypothetical protein